MYFAYKYEAGCWIIISSHLSADIEAKLNENKGISSQLASRW